jgi:hypothetical protein
MLIRLNLIYVEKGAGQKMFPDDILVETPPPTMKTTRQACGLSLDVKGGDRSLSSDIYKKQYLCQIIKKGQILYKNRQI